MVACGAALLACLAFASGAASYDLGTLQVEVGEPFVINKSDTERCWFPYLLTHISEKKLLLAHTMSADEIKGRGVACLVTEDGGHTWSEPMVRAEFPSPWIRLRDGTFVGTQAYPDYVSEHVASFQLSTSRDGVHCEMSPSTVDGSPHRFTKGAKNFCGMVFCRSMIEALDGSLLAHMYGRFAGDVLDRSILVRSTDKGTTWKYFSTIGYDPAVGGEGLNEPCMVRLANGALFCFMRNQSGRPMFRSRSTDDGKTWSKPKRMPEKYASMSVFPDLVLMKSGLLACSAGRPKCQLAFCQDPYGTAWTDPITIFEGPSTCYTAIREVGPDTLLYVHDVVPAGWNEPKPGQFHEIVGRFITVKRR